MPVFEQEPVVGLDIETLMDCRTWCLSQISLPTFTVVVDMLAINDRRPIARLTENRSIVKVVHNASFERGVLDKHGIGLENVFDTVRASRGRHGKIAGGHNLAAVCRRELGLELDKSLSCSNWTVRPLRKEMLDYAALDAEVLIDLHRIFSA